MLFWRFWKKERRAKKYLSCGGRGCTGNFKSAGKYGRVRGNLSGRLFENVSEIKKTAYPTIGMLYQEQENKMETLFIPYVGEAEKNLP